MIRDGRLVTPQRGWAWVVPFVLAWLGPGLASATGLGLGLVLASGLVAGAGWHWLNRREVAARLTVPSVIVVYLTSSLAIDRGMTRLERDDLVGLLVFWPSVVAAVVLTERFMRWREGQAWRYPDAHVTAPADT